MHSKSVWHAIYVNRTPMEHSWKGTADPLAHRAERQSAVRTLFVKICLMFIGHRRISTFPIYALHSTVANAGANH